MTKDVYATTHGRFLPLLDNVKNSLSNASFEAIFTAHDIASGLQSKYLANDPNLAQLKSGFLSGRSVGSSERG